MVPFDQLLSKRGEIGFHRGRRWGLRETLGFNAIEDLSFSHLARRVKRAYAGDAPKHRGWQAQREAIRWLVDRGCEGIYALDEMGIVVYPAHPPATRPYRIKDGHHRALALYILGASDVRATVAATPRAAPALNSGSSQLNVRTSFVRGKRRRR